MPSKTTYCDEEVLADYVWQFFAELVPKSERCVAVVYHAERYAAIGNMAPTRLVRYNMKTDEVMRRVFESGAREPYFAIARRVVAEHPSEVVINRCPRCARVVATPLAQQCLWCGHDWHVRIP